MEIAVARHNNDRSLLLIGFKVRIHEMGQAFKQGKIRQRRDQAAGQDNFFPADTIGERTKNKKERSGKHQRKTDQHIGRNEIELEINQKKEEGVELACVPHNALTCGSAEERNRNIHIIRKFEKTIDERLCGALTLRLHALKNR